MTKWDRFRGATARVHDDMDYPEGVFENWSGSSYDPDSGQMTGGSWAEIGRAPVEEVPPTIDSTVDVEAGTSNDFDTSLRLPWDVVDGFDAELVPYGEDSEKPTRITVDGTVYELQAKPLEHGSGMLLLRVTEK